jgi:CHAT domain-containing protein
MQIYQCFSRVALCSLTFIFWSILSMTSHASSLNEIESIKRLIDTGYYHDAKNELSRLLQKAEKNKAYRDESVILGLLGDIALKKQFNESAKNLFSQGMDIAKSQKFNDLVVLHQNYLANYHYNLRRYPEAKKLYSKSLEWADKHDKRSMAIKIRFNLIKLSQKTGEYQKTLALLNQVEQDLKLLSDHSENLWLKLGYLRLEQVKKTILRTPENIKSTYNALIKAAEGANQLSNIRAESLAYGYLGHLYELEKRWKDSLKYTGQATLLAQRANAVDLLIEWEWQRGRLLKGLKDNTSALSAYRRAVELIESIREDIPVGYQNGRSSFKETLGPIYLGLVELQLIEANSSGETFKPTLLKQVRETVELIKKTELEDYFNSRCDFESTEKANVSFESVNKNTATLYPIILPESIELILSIGEAIHHRSIPVHSSNVNDTAQFFAEVLRNEEPEYKMLGNKLYHWLIKPVEKLLEESLVDTLVFVPDGSLRLVPLAALYDGKHFLIERFALVNSAGLTLANPTPISRKETQTLIAGLSLPGPVLNQLPSTLITDVIEASLPEMDASSQRAIQITKGQKRDLKPLLKDLSILEKVRDFLSLPGVKKEVDSLSNHFQIKPLIDQSFTKKNFVDTLVKNPHQIVHIASHGVFGGTAEQSFIMTYDKLINTNELQLILQNDVFEKNPIDLLTLSACETAEGDDRAPLGLSGIALRSNVRSVLGSLWPVDDEATVLLMENFYENFSDSSISKAKALQKSQIKVLKNREFEHPVYWSPFILVGNWL